MSNVETPGGMSEPGGLALPHTQLGPHIAPDVSRVGGGRGGMG